MVNRENLYEKIAEICENEYSDIFSGSMRVGDKLRIYLIDGSYIDVWLSEERPVFGCHWERRMIDGTIYRHNNFPDRKAKNLKTFPKHFHDGNDETVKESYISDNPEEAVREFLGFARKIIGEQKLPILKLFGGEK